jgi:hypothetical protein
MSQQPPDSTQEELIPPEEHFWKRYSPRHEFPLSSVGSVVLHVLSIGALIVIGYVITRTGNDDQKAPPSLDVIAAPGLPPMNAGGGGEPGGSDSAPGGTRTKGQEIAANQEPPEPRPGNQSPDTSERLEQVKLPPIQVVTSDDGKRAIVGENRKVFGDLNVIVDQAKNKLEQAIARADAAKGKGGSGKGGGKGSGEGPGVGGGKGPGVAGGNATIRQRRQARWKMFFNTAGGDDYLKQMRGLGAILAIPQLKGDNQLEYLVIRDIRRGASFKREDVSKLNLIFWFDKEQRSVLTVAKALGLRNPPPFFVAFFPQELEERLLQLERQAYSGDEDRIVETHFRVVNRGGVYQAELDPVNPIVLKR